MKIYILLFVTLTSLSCSTLFNRNPANTVAGSHKPRHVIITVHGLSGNTLTWGHFEDVTKQYLPLVRPDTEVVISNFIYPTGQSEKLSTFDFANKLNEHIEKLFRDQPIQPDDRISLVGHSQGGIVSYIWFFSRILNDHLDQTYISHVESIITLGTPFWGSKLATMLTDKRIPNIVPIINLLAETPITRRELVDMSFGSDSLHTFRQLAIKMDTDPALQARLQALPVRLINIMGVLPQKESNIFANRNANSVSKFARKLVGYIYDLFQTTAETGTSRVESDIAVMIPSGRWNFIYAEPQVVKTGSNVIASESFHHFKNFTERDRSKFLFTESVHLPFDNDNTLSMAYINESCMKVETCDHPTYRYVLEQLANCEHAVCDPAQYTTIIQGMKNITYVDDDKKIIRSQDTFRQIQEGLQTFTIQVEMKLKPGVVASFPVKYFTKNGQNAEGADIWELREPSLLGKVIDLKRNGKQISIASNADREIYVGPKTETRGIDIVSKESRDVLGHDVIRMNIVGYVKNSKAEQERQTKENDDREEQEKATRKRLPQLHRQTTVPLTIRLPGQPKVDIQAVIEPGYSTYLPLDYTKLQ